jgi:predicted nucleic acid-binding Zn ribbon protein
MTDRKRRRIWNGIYILTVAVCLVNCFVLPETAVAGIMVRGTVRTLTYAPKWKIILGGLGIPPLGRLFWKYWVQRLDRKIVEHPKINSYRRKRNRAATLSWMLSIMGLITNLFALIMNW